MRRDQLHEDGATRSSDMTAASDDVTPPASGPTGREPRTPEPPAREPGNIKRHLLFGLALALAFGSIYAGVLGGGRVLQWALAVGAAIVVIIAMATGPAKRR